MDAPTAPMRTSGQPLLELTGIGKTFGTYRALEDVSLRIEQGEFFALLGPSGCGKTTLMRILAGFETPTEGQVFLDGKCIAEVPPNKRPFNMMFQSYALFPHMSVEKNVAFGLERAGLPRDEVRARVAEMLALVQLGPFAGRKPDSLSGGQKQRVALARALACRPRLLLLDEPMGALDKKLRQETQLELVNIQKSLGMTFVIVTHDQEEAMTVATRIAVMKGGRLSQVATPLEIYEAPNSRFVADFIGEVTLIEGSTRPMGSGRYAVTIPGGVVQARSDASLATDKPVWLALRPEKIALSPVKPDAVNALPGRVEDMAYLGNVTTYRVRLGDGSILRAQRANSTHDSARAVSPGQDVWVSWSEDAATLLDR
ncbi:MAG: ABC transporter ATP-binding protein [Paracoccaceae bacterium]